MDCSWLISAYTYKTYLAPSLTPIIIIVGWIFVSKDNDRRETRKEIRKVIDSITLKLDTLYNESTHYFCAIDNKDSSAACRAEVRIKQNIEKVDGELEILSKINKHFNSASAFLDTLASAITGHPKFESRSLCTPIPHNDESLLSIALHQKNLLNELEQTYIDTQIKPRHKPPY